MTAEDRHERMEAARMRSELTVQDLWPRYVALGGTGDAFDLDGYLQGLVPLESFQQDVLAQALNEALDDLYTAHHVPLSAGSADGFGRGTLQKLVEWLLREQSPAHRSDDAPPP
jgi:hypothetical protein